VIEDLKKFPGWESGTVEVRGGADGSIQRKGGFNNFSLEKGDQMISGIKCA